MRSVVCEVDVDDLALLSLAALATEDEARALDFAVAARVAPAAHAVVERDRFDAERTERRELARIALSILVAIEPQDELVERRVTSVEDAVMVFVELGERLEAVLRVRPVG